MSPHIFVMAAGGSGAKMVEALVHLCAAGLGPDQLDVLLLDVDQNNGNSKRCQALLSLYQNLQAASWRTKPDARAKGAAAPEEIHFFRTRITSHCQHEPVQIVKHGGLHLHLLQEKGAQPVLDLLFDEDEQTSPCEKGFMARPNLGSLILGGHLSEAFGKPGSAANSWKVRLSESMSAQTDIPLFVVGSVFGGTGASLFPVACKCLSAALGYNTSDEKWKKIVPSAIMLLPYFHPASKPGDKVDASRFHADTITTLKHYERSSAMADYQCLYLVGSDDSSRNTLKYSEGASDQSNPCHLEEFIAACAVLHGNTSAANTDGKNLHLVSSMTGADLDWNNLPIEASRLALFAHFCAFLLAPTNPNLPLASGLLSFIRNHSSEMSRFPAVDKLLRPWASVHLTKNVDPDRPCWEQLMSKDKSGNASVTHYQEHIAEYAWRFLLWARHALPRNENHYLTEFGHEGDYALVWEVLCSLRLNEIDPDTAAAGNDNTLIRLCRAAACALEKIATGQYVTKPAVLNADSRKPIFPGSHTETQSFCRIPLNDKQLKEAGAEHQLRQTIHEDYTKTVNSH